MRICSLKRVCRRRQEPAPRAAAAVLRGLGKAGGDHRRRARGTRRGGELKRLGHAVTVFEREPYLGGQMRIGVPMFRLPREVLEADIRAITDSGVDVALNHAVDHVRLREMLAQFDAVLLAAGANQPRSLDLDGLPPVRPLRGCGS